MPCLRVGTASKPEVLKEILLPAADDTMFECPIEAWDDPGHQAPEWEAGIWLDGSKDATGSEERDHPVDRCWNVLDVVKYVHADDGVEMRGGR